MSVEIPAQPDRRTGRVEQGELHRQVGTRFAARQQRLLDLQRLSCRENREVVCSLSVGDLGREEVMTGLPDRIVAPDPERGLPVPVDQLVPSVDVLQVDRRRGIVEDVLQPLLTLAESLRRLLALERLALETLRGGRELGGARVHPRLELGVEPCEAIFGAPAPDVLLDEATVVALQLE